MNPVRSLAKAARRLLAEPLTARLDLDDVETTLLRRSLVQSKKFLRKLYGEWYGLIADADPALPDALLEIGAGGGFLAYYLPRVITSEILQVSGVDVVLDARALPFRSGSLRGVAMTNVLHHLPEVADFFAEVERCVKPGGAVLLIEPWVTRWSRLIYGSFHHEPFNPDSNAWGLTAGKPLSAANGALPWILFERDHDKFAREFPSLNVESIRPIMSFVYLLSGGVSVRALAPGWTFSFFSSLDRLIIRVLPQSAMFALIVVRRRDESSRVLSHPAQPYVEKSY